MVANALPNKTPDRREFPASQPIQTRLAPITSVDVATRAVELVFATETPVRRARWSWATETAIPFDEILVVSRTAVSLDRLNAGGPVLDSHRTWGLDSLRAVVDRAWIDGKDARAMVRFPEAGTVEESDRLFRLIEQKIVKNVSAGYSHDKVRIERPGKEGEVERWFVERWTPHEISFVTVPADPNSQVRGEVPTDGTVRLFPIEFDRPAPAFDARRMRMQMRQRQAGLIR